MLYYVSGLERDFYRRILRASILFLCFGLLLGTIGGYKYKTLDGKYREEKIQQILTEKRAIIADLEVRLGLLQGKGKPKTHGHERKTK
jgi:hypothetical protein